MTGALIVTASLDAASQARFNDERRKYFPPSRNFLQAHVTLFHTLPKEELESVKRTLGSVSRAQAPLRFIVRGLSFLGRGVAYDLHMPDVIAVREVLAAAWWDWLTPQDRQTFKPHVTVQNKVSPEDAKALFTTLRVTFGSWEGEVTGLALWRYENGPWAAVDEMRFTGSVDGRDTTISGLGKPESLL